MFKKNMGIAMKVQNIFTLSIAFMIAALITYPSGAQETVEYGKVLSVSEDSASINFENRTLHTGDEISIVRRINIVDPISGRLMGGRYETVATGVVDEAGIDKSEVSILWRAPRYSTIELNDQVSFTGRSIDYERANIIIGKAQNLLMESREIEIDFGEDEDINQGDLFLIQRTEYTYDPDTNEIVDTQVVEVGRGRISTVGGTSSLGEIIFNPGYELDLETDDIVINTAEKEPLILKPRDEVIGKIQELVSDTRIDIDVGEEEEVNEGDLFLIQRTENTYDPDTKEIIESKQVEVGRGSVSLLSGHSSRGELELNPGMEINLETDNIVFEAITDIPYDDAFDDPEIAQGVRREINNLKRELLQLKTTVDSLGIEHSEHRNEFDTFKNEIETMFSSLMSGDMVGTKILIKNDEPFTPSISENLANSYKRALDNCLSHRSDKAIAEFENIISNYPNSKLIENCRYWIAQSHYSMRDYDSAIQGFRAVIEDTRFDHKNDDASIMLGISYYLAGNKTEALVEFQKFFINYPDSEYREKVNYWIQRLS
ncbi:tol-pal system YbgF family protein [Candidatus Latescibacterota bacterium]